MRTALPCLVFVVTLIAACGEDAFVPADTGGGAGGALGTGGSSPGGFGGTSGGAAGKATGGAGAQATGGAAGQATGGAAGQATGGAAGQTAPECQSAADCDKEKNRCLGIPLCSAGKCLFVDAPVVDDGNACTKDTCEKLTGSVLHEPLPVGDGDPCTLDVCDPATGVRHDKKASCDGCKKDADCDDGNACTTETCVDKKCPSVALPAGAVCGKGNACREDKVCDASGKCLGGKEKNIDDADKCTLETCVNGNVVSTPKPVNDKNACTVDTCDKATGDAKNVLSPIDDGNPCTEDSCDKATGISHAPVKLTDGDACTVDSCDPVKGVVHTPIAGCAGCTVDADCDDQDPCTTETCPVPGGKCQRVAAADGKACDDSSFCNGTEACKAGKCASTPRDLSDGLLCTLDTCNEATNAIDHPPVAIVDDQNACTTDACNPATGAPMHTPLTIGGCCTEDANCPGAASDPTDECFSPPTCDLSTHKCEARISIPLTDKNACTVDACSAKGEVTHTPVSVDDGNACTLDTCSPQTGNINHAQKEIDDGNACTLDACNPASGQVTHALTAVIDDGNACTLDSCSPKTGEEHTPLTTGGCCATNADCPGGVFGNACFPATACNLKTFSCDAAGPGSGPVNDGNLCTNDTCIANGTVVRTFSAGPGCCETDVSCPRTPNDNDNGVCFAASTCDLPSFACFNPEGIKLTPPGKCQRSVCGPDGATVFCCVQVDDCPKCPIDSNSACNGILR